MVTEADGLRQVRVLVADGLSSVRMGLGMIVNGALDMRAVGEVAEEAELVLKVEELQPDVVLLDVDLPGLEVLETMRRIKRDHENLRFLVLAAFEPLEAVLRAIDAGADGFLTKDLAAKCLCEAVRTVYLGGIYFSPPVLRAKLSEDLVVPSHES